MKHALPHPPSPQYPISKATTALSVPSRSTVFPNHEEDAWNLPDSRIGRREQTGPSRPNPLDKEGTGALRPLPVPSRQPRPHPQTSLAA